MRISRTSSTSSARIEAKADRAALIEWVAALKKKHSIEDQEEQLEEQLRKEKEQLELETELAATNAKLHVLENTFHHVVVQNVQTAWTLILKRTIVKNQVN